MPFEPTYRLWNMEGLEIQVPSHAWYHTSKIYRNQVLVHNHTLCPWIWCQCIPKAFEWAVLTIHFKSHKRVVMHKRWFNRMFHIRFKLSYKRWNYLPHEWTNTQALELTSYSNVGNGFEYELLSCLTPQKSKFSLIQIFFLEFANYIQVRHRVKEYYYVRQ